MAKAKKTRAQEQSSGKQQEVPPEPVFLKAAAGALLICLVVSVYFNVYLAYGKISAEAAAEQAKAQMAEQRDIFVQGHRLMIRLMGDLQVLSREDEAVQKLLKKHDIDQALGSERKRPVSPSLDR